MAYRIDSLNEQVIQNARLSFDESILIQGYHAPGATADVELSFQLKEYSAGDTVTVTARGSSSQTYTAMAARSDTGRFSAGMTLPVEDNYRMTFSTEGGTTIRSAELMRFDLADRLTGYARFNYSLGYGHTSGGNQSDSLTLQPDFSNNMQGTDALRIMGMTLSMETNGGVVMTWDLLPYLQNADGSQLLQLDENNRTAFQVMVGSEAGQIELNKWIDAKITMYDSLGLRYERTDPVYAYISGNPNIGGGVGSGGVGSAAMPAIPVASGAGTGYNANPFRIVKE
ncbi:MAG: hypothetical protein FWH28_06710 [Clostridiales bacterium]|nr:hypothetical protein [Clostridiales bacterium]